MSIEKQIRRAPRPPRAIARTDVTFAAMGTLGDVLPAIAVAHEVARRGLAVRFSTHDRFMTLIDRSLRGRALPFDPIAVLGTRAGVRLLDGGWLGIRRLAGLYGLYKPRI